MRVSILQSNYIPWKGYFDLIAASDLCVLYDTRQYTKNDWRNRNKVIVDRSPLWLTVPVKTGGRLGQRICDTEVASGAWARKHWRTIEQAYSRRPEFARYADRWGEEWRALEEEALLSVINERLIRLLMGDLDISADLQRDSDVEGLGTILEDAADHPSRVVARICAAVEATEYLTGPAGLGYLRTEDFRERGIRLVVADYGGYQKYPQATNEFTHSVSVLDMIANLGREARGQLIGRSWTSLGETHPGNAGVDLD